MGPATLPKYHYGRPTTAPTARHTNDPSAAMWKWPGHEWEKADRQTAQNALLPRCDFPIQYSEPRGRIKYAPIAPWETNRRSKWRGMTGGRRLWNRVGRAANTPQWIGTAGGEANSCLHSTPLGSGTPCGTTVNLREWRFFSRLRLVRRLPIHLAPNLEPGCTGLKSAFVGTQFWPWNSRNI